MLSWQRRPDGRTITVPIRTPWEFHADRGSRADAAAGGSPLAPVLHEPRPTGLTYEPFYGLKEKAFSLTSDARFFYHSRSHAPAFDDLLAGIRRRESLNVLTGDIGTGKTTLCRAVLEDLDRKTFSAFVPDPFASREDLLKVLLMDFGVVSVDDLTSGRLKEASRTELSYLLYEFLGTLAPLQAFAVAIIDEAQNLSLPLLEEIRILSDADGQLQVVLVGQLELREKLKLPEMRQVDQRVSVHCSLAPLECDGVAGYIAHRLQTAGGSPDRVRFSPEAVEAVYLVSGGVPRLINRLCDRALHQGHLRRAATIDREIVEAALPDAVPSGPVTVTVSHTASAPVPAPVPAAVAAANPPLAGPASAPPQLPDAIDMWLEGVEELATPPGPYAPPIPPEVPRPARLIPPARLQGTQRASVPRFQHGFVPRVHVPRPPRVKVARRLFRRLAVALLCVAAAGATVAGTPSLLEASTVVWGRWTELFASPSAPAFPAGLPLPLAPALKPPPPPADATPAPAARRAS
jgi:general secretion pathway protein A